MSVALPVVSVLPNEMKGPALKASSGREEIEMPAPRRPRGLDL
jgi:hypothetical protein